MTVNSGAGAAPPWSCPRRVVVVGFDGSFSAIDAAGYACDLAERERLRLLFVDLWDGDILDGLLPVALADRGELIEAFNAGVEAQLADIVAGRAVDWEVRHTVGDPFDDLVAIATEAHADTVVVGKPNGGRWRLTGSMAGRLRRLGRWTVVTVDHHGID